MSKREKKPPATSKKTTSANVPSSQIVPTKDSSNLCSDISNDASTNETDSDTDSESQIAGIVAESFTPHLGS